MWNMFDLEENRSQSTVHLQKGGNGHVKVSSCWLACRVLIPDLGVPSVTDLQSRMGTERKGRIGITCRG